MQFMDPDIEVFVSSHSKKNPYHPGEKAKLFDSGLYCETVIKTREKLNITNALANELWKDNPDIKLNMISYLGFPILLPNKEPFGTICVLNNRPTEFSKTVERLMRKFCSLIESHLEMIYVNQLLGDKNKRLVDYLMELQFLRGLISICSSCKSIKDNQGKWHSIESYLIKHPEADFSNSIYPTCMKKLYPKFNETKRIPSKEG